MRYRGFSTWGIQIWPFVCLLRWFCPKLSHLIAFHTGRSIYPTGAVGVRRRFWSKGQPILGHSNGAICNLLRRFYSKKVQHFPHSPIINHFFLGLGTGEWERWRKEAAAQQGQKIGKVTPLLNVDDCIRLKWFYHDNFPYFHSALRSWASAWKGTAQNWRSGIHRLWAAL